MQKKVKHVEPPVVVRPPKKPSLLRKASQLGATMIVARVAAATGNKGVLGLAAGVGAKRLIMRYPMGAMIVTGAYLARKLYKARQEIDQKRQPKLLTDQRRSTSSLRGRGGIKERPATP